MALRQGIPCVYLQADRKPHLQSQHCKPSVACPLSPLRTHCAIPDYHHVFINSWLT